MEVIYKVKQYRKLKGFTIRGLALKSGVSKSTISDIENKKLHPTVPIICKLAEALDIDARDLYEYF